MRRERFHDAVVACAFFAGTVFLFEAALYAPGMRPGALSYLAVDAALTLGIVLVLALAASTLAGRAAPQAAMVALAALTLVHDDLAPRDVARAAAVAVILAAALFVDRRRHRRPTALALVSAAAVCFAFRAWPRLCEVVRPLRPLSNGVTAAAAEVLVFAACMAAALAYAAFRQRGQRRLPAEAAVALSALALVTIVATAADASRSAGPSTLPAPAEGTRNAAEQPSILVVVLDTVGADRMSIYGHSRPTTPELQAFLERSERAVRYPLAFSAAPWTGPSHASLFTGRLSSEHGVERGAPVGSRRIGVPLLSQTLRDHGYRTAAVAANPMLSYVRSLLDGFDVVVRWRPIHPLLLTPGESVRVLLMPQIGVRAIKPTPAAETVNRAVLDLVSQCADGPCFVFANYMDAHQPYAPHPPYAGRWAGRWARDDGDDRKDRLEVAAARHDEAILGLDAALGKLLAELDSSGVLDRWWIVITADHGEAFGQHGYVRHGRGLHVEQTKVPLIIAPPRGDRVPTRSDPVSLIDVATTLAALGGVDDFGVGDDLRRSDANPRPARMEFAGVPGSRVKHRMTPSRAVVVGRRQLIDTAGRWELYDVADDRAEQHDLAASAPDEVERLEALLPPGVPAARKAGEPGARSKPPAELDEDARRNLKALGYLD